MRMKAGYNKLYRFLVMAGLLLPVACTEAQDKAIMTTARQDNPYYSRTDTAVLEVDNETWKEILPAEVYYIAREQGTERAFTGQYWNADVKGTYFCAVCGNRLFQSDAKFASSCGWPSFYEVVRPESVRYLDDHTHGMSRTEVRCGRCDSHLGHIFDDGPPPTYKRFCMNGTILDFEPDK